MNMDAQGHEAIPKLEGEASPAPRGRPGRRGAEEKTRTVSTPAASCARPHSSAAPPSCAPPPSSRPDTLPRNLLRNKMKNGEGALAHEVGCHAWARRRRTSRPRRGAPAQPLAGARNPASFPGISCER
jgi:hypothetical protein